MYTMPTAPRTVAQVLESTVALYRHSFVQLLPLTVFAIISIVIQNAFTLTRVLPKDPLELMKLPGFRLVLVSSSIVAVLAYGVLWAKMDFLARGQPMSSARALAIGLRALPTLAGSTLLFLLACVAGTFLFFIPGIIVSVSLWLYGPLVMLEGKGVFASLKESYLLVRGSWWFVAATQLGGVLPIFCFAILMLLLTDGLVRELPESAATRLIVRLVISSAVTAITTPLLVALVLETYYELKIRRAT